MIAVDREGLVYLLQRGDKADPIIVLDREVHVVRSWGRGLYTMPHSIRIDPHGDIWTTDAASSMVMKFSPRGKKLLEIPVGGTPAVWYESWRRHLRFDNQISQMCLTTTRTRLTFGNTLLSKSIICLSPQDSPLSGSSRNAAGYPLRTYGLVRCSTT